MNEWLDQLKQDQQLNQLEQGVKARMTRDAYARYSNIRAADPEYAVQALIKAAQYIDKQKRDIDDEEFKRILKEIAPRRGFNIRRR